MISTSTIEIWEPSLAPETKEQVVNNLFFINANGLECELPVSYDDFFHPKLEWELHLDFPAIADYAPPLVCFDSVPERVMFGIQYATVREIVNHYPELMKFLNVEWLSGGRIKNEQEVLTDDTLSQIHKEA